MEACNQVVFYAKDACNQAAFFFVLSMSAISLWKIANKIEVVTMVATAALTNSPDKPLTGMK